MEKKCSKPPISITCYNPVCCRMYSTDISINTINTSGIRELRIGWFWKICLVICVADHDFAIFVDTNFYFDPWKSGYKPSTVVMGIYLQHTSNSRLMYWFNPLKLRKFFIPYPLALITNPGFIKFPC